MFWSWRIAALGAIALTSKVVAECDPIPTVYKDVVIIGGGASGTYAAVRLREDYNTSILLIEQLPVLGGHVNTYTDPETEEAFNYGVQSYIDYKGAKAFFARFDIPIQGDVLFSSDTTSVDSSTGIIVPNAPSPSSNETFAAIQRYYNAILPWNNISLPGYWSFPPGNQIPADLLLPFNEFVAKYRLEAMGDTLAYVSGQDINSKAPTFITAKNFGTPVVEGIFNDTFFDPAPFNNSLLYGRAGELLGEDVFLSSTVVNATRTSNGTSLIVENIETKKRTQVFAKRLLIASQPSLENLAVFELDQQEKAVFSTWSYTQQYTAVLKTNLVPDNTSISFITPANSTATPAGFSITWNGAPNYFWIIFSFNETMSESQAKEHIEAQTQVLYDGGQFRPIGNSTPIVEVVAISNHSQVVWGQSPEQFKAGLVQDLYALQGHRDTWYTGGLWCPDYSSNVWAFTDTVLPRLLKGL